MGRGTALSAIQGLIFDLDGTLVDSGLDFQAIRAEMGIPAGQPILETIEQMSEAESRRCTEILAAHEWRGAERAELFPGVRATLAMLANRGYRTALLTRNSRAVVDATLARVGLAFDSVLAREDARPKPDPLAIQILCESWQLPPARVAIIGDYVFDVEAGRRAGARTVLFTRGRDLQALPFAADADFVLASWNDARSLVRWLEQPA